MPGTGLPDLVAQAYEAACDTAGMAGFIQNTAEYFGAQQAAITICPHEKPEAFLPITHGISQEEIRDLFVKRDDGDTVFTALARTPAGNTVAIEHYEPAAATPNSPMRRQTDVRLESVNVLAGVVVADEQNRCELMLFRDKMHGEYSPSEHETLQELMGYLRRAIELNKRFVKIFVEHRTAISVIDNAPRCIMILGQTGKVTYRNEPAGNLLTKNDGISLEDGLFAVEDPTARDQVESFLERARRGNQPEIDTQRLMIVVPRLSGGSPYKLVMYKLPFDVQKAALDSDDYALAVALVYDPSTMDQLNQGLLSKFYSLTAAESALAQELYDGRTLPEASVDLGVSVNTARTQLRSIFKKVGVHSQSALLQEFAKSFIHA